MGTLHSGKITIPGESGEITLEYREQEERNAVLELSAGDIRLNAPQLRMAAEELEQKEKHLKFMRGKYAELLATALMFADEERDGPPRPQIEDGEEDEEEDIRCIEEIVQTDGDLIDSRETDTGNPFSGDSIIQLYQYRDKFWLIDGTHGSSSEYDSYEEAHRILYRLEDENE